ncbi:hypothetical protein B296_00014503 [Ensete ventricosum]|uniref:Uncharacterized protein n=1 Tax=Ensete ventricosum TaxID=4639 RepID=A0A426ZK20_ENSVE|nr:hypothetical protein B296_00014503 [Ensete ventricosum]
MRPPASAIYLPASSLALGPRASGDASRIPTFLGSSVGYSLDSTWVDGKRLHLALGNPRSGTAPCGTPAYSSAKVSLPRDLPESLRLTKEKTGQKKQFPWDPQATAQANTS